MREIRFRAIHKLTKHWFEDTNIVYENGKWFEDGRSHEDYRPMNLEQIAVMQYTGLKDKNGVEIYEGDVLSGGGREILMCEVVYDAPSFSRRWLNKRTASIMGRGLEPLAWNTHIMYAVIGNIYENPELLGDSQ